MNIFAIRLNRAMDARGIGPTAFAAEAKVTPYTIRAMMNGAITPDIVMLEKIAGALDLPMDYFTTEDDEKAMAYLRKDGQETNEEPKRACDKTEQIMMIIKATCFDVIDTLRAEGYSENEVYVTLSAMNDMIVKVGKAVKGM